VLGCKPILNLIIFNKIVLVPFAPCHLRLLDLTFICSDVHAGLLEHYNMPCRVRKK
jgi:hypothetical protein